MYMSSRMYLSGLLQMFSVCHVIIVIEMCRLTASYLQDQAAYFNECSSSDARFVFSQN